MLTAVHFLLTYTCLFECDHCFLYCSPNSTGTFTCEQLRSVLEEATKIPTVESICFEGGEPFLFYPIMLEGIRIARDRGFAPSLVTNTYWATSAEDAELWLAPLKELNLSEIEISDDLFHHGEGEDSPSRAARAAAAKLGLPASTICIEEPVVRKNPEKGEPVIGGGAMLKGRAVDKLTEGLPRRPWRELTSCPHEELEKPRRVHVDAFGNVQVCQGLSIGNLWITPLSELDRTYDHRTHPICGPLVEGGPALLASKYGVEHEDEYVDECHFCFAVRRALIDRYPQYLAPRQVYGLEEE